MSMKKKKHVEMSIKSYLKEELSDNKIWIFSIFVLVALWVFNFIYNVISVFELVLTIMTILYVMVLFYISIKNGAQYLEVLDSVQNNPDIQNFFKLMEGKSEDEIEEIISKVTEKE